jgi:hypothetical protein
MQDAKSHMPNAKRLSWKVLSLAGPLAGLMTQRLLTPAAALACRPSRIRLVMSARSSCAIPDDLPHEGSHWVIWIVLKVLALVESRPAVECVWDQPVWRYVLAGVDDDLCLDGLTLG